MRQNMSFGWASKYVIWLGVEICHLVSRVEICHLVGRRNMSFGRATKYVIWSGLEICHLVERRNRPFGQMLKYLNICHFDGYVKQHIMIIK